jgi:cell division initiation protein
MSMTPVEVRHLHFRRGLFGYRRRTVRDLLDEIAESFEQVWRERGELTDRVEQLESDLARHVELEGLLRSTLISAERAAQEQRERARREADTILNEAYAEARSLTREARAEKERLASETRRITSLLRSALALVDGENAEPKDAPAAPGRPAERERTEIMRPGAPGADTPEVRRLAG